MSVHSTLLFIAVMAMTCSKCTGFQWLSVPNTVNACVGGDAILRWSYNASMYTDIQMIYWRFGETGNTVLGHHFYPRDELFYYEHYPQTRVILTDRNEANAGIVLKGVRPSDAGKYTVELSGPEGATGEAQLKVFPRAALIPTLQIDNHDIQFGDKSNVTLCKSCIIVITTSHALPADITITSGESRIPCNQRTTCSMSLNWDGVEARLTQINFEIDYGFCEKIERSVEVFWSSPTTGEQKDGGGNNDDKNLDGDNDNNGSGQNISIIIGVVIGVLLSVIIILVAMVCLLYKRLQRRRRRGKGLTTREDAFMSAVKKWRTVAKRAKAAEVVETVEPEAGVAYRRSASVPANSERASLQDARNAEFKADIEPRPRDHLLAIVDEDSLDGKGPHDREDPEGEVGPKVVVDPEVGEKAGDSIPSTEEGIEAKESDMGSASPDCSRMDSIDSSSFVMVQRNPDGGESPNNSFKMH